MLGRTAVVDRGAKESLPEEGMSEQRLEGGEGQSHGDISGCASREGTVSAKALRGARNVSRLTRRPEQLKQN